MVIHHIKKFIDNQRRKLEARRKEKSQLESFKETEEMKKAEEIKKEADRLAQLKQYKTAIEEYAKALELYPSKDFIKPEPTQAINSATSTPLLDPRDPQYQNWEAAIQNWIASSTISY